MNRNSHKNEGNEGEAKPRGKNCRHNTISQGLTKWDVENSLHDFPEPFQKVINRIHGHPNSDYNNYISDAGEKRVNSFFTAWIPLYSFFKKNCQCHMVYREVIQSSEGWVKVPKQTQTTMN